MRVAIDLSLSELTPTFTFCWTEVSAKFFNPAGWTILLTLFEKSSQVIGLLTEYDKFW